MTNSKIPPIFEIEWILARICVKCIVFYCSHLSNAFATVFFDNLSFRSSFKLINKAAISSLTFRQQFKHILDLFRGAIVHAKLVLNMKTYYRGTVYRVTPFYTIQMISRNIHVGHESTE